MEVSPADSGVRRFQAEGTSAKVLRERCTSCLQGQLDEQRWRGGGADEVRVACLRRVLTIIIRDVRSHCREGSLLIKPKERKLGAVKSVGGCCKYL